jgi:hypothetical protein
MLSTFFFLAVKKFLTGALSSIRYFELYKESVSAVSDTITESPANFTLDKETTGSESLWIFLDDMVSCRNTCNQLHRNMNNDKFINNNEWLFSLFLQQTYFNNP